MAKIKHPFIGKISNIKNKIETIIKRMDNLCPCDDSLELLDTKQVMAKFRIDEKTCKKWRDEGILPYSRIKNKLYYKFSDLKQLIEQHKINCNE